MRFFKLYNNKINQRLFHVPIPDHLVAFNQETYDQPFLRKSTLASDNFLLQEQLADWVHQIYFDQKKLSELSVLRLIEHPFQVIKPNIKCSIMYSIIHRKVQQVCQAIRCLILDSYNRLESKKQVNSDLKHSSDSWNVNFSKFRKGNVQSSMNKVYGPIAHIICTYHNSLVDCNKQVYDLWKLLYHSSEKKDLEFKTLQGSLNELILEELMQEYPNHKIIPKDIMPTLSVTEKHTFIFKEMWGFQKRKLAVQFHIKNQGSNETQKPRQNSIMGNQNLAKRAVKDEIVFANKPITLSNRLIGVKPARNDQKQQTKQDLQRQKIYNIDRQNEIKMKEIEQQLSILDAKTRMNILQSLQKLKNNEKKQELLNNIQQVILEHIAQGQKSKTLQGQFDRQTGEKKIGGKQPNDKRISDKQISDKQISDKQISDKQISDKQISEKQISGVKTDEKEVCSKQVSEKQTVDKKTSAPLEVSIKISQKQFEEANKSSLNKQEKQSDRPNQKNELFIKIKAKKNEVQEYYNFRQPAKLQITKDKQQWARQTGERYIRLCQRRDTIKKSKFEPKDIQNKLIQACYISREMEQIEKDFQQLVPIYINKIFKKECEFLSEDQSQNIRKDPFISSIQKRQLQINQEQLQKNAFTYNLDDHTIIIFHKSSMPTTKQKGISQSIPREQFSEEKKRSINNNKISQWQTISGRVIEATNANYIISDKSKNTINHKQYYKLEKIFKPEQNNNYQISQQKEKNQKKIRKEIKAINKKNTQQTKKGEGSIQTIKRQLVIDNFNQFDQKIYEKYHLGETNQFVEKLIDEPREDIHEDKPQKKKKKKKKKKNKKKELSEENSTNFDKASTDSFNDEQQDLQPLHQFKKKSICDFLNLKKMMNWPEGQFLKECLQSSEMFERQKEQELFIQKKMQLYEKNEQKRFDKNEQSDKKSLQKQNKNKKQNYSQDELKLIQFLETLEIKDQNRQKCIVSEQSLQRIVMKRKQIKQIKSIKSMKLVDKVNLDLLQVSHSKEKEENKSISVHKNSADQLITKASKPKNKKKKK